MRRWMKLVDGKNEEKGKAHNFQFHRKEINVYRRIDCGTEATEKKNRNRKRVSACSGEIRSIDVKN